MSPSKTVLLLALTAAQGLAACTPKRPATGPTPQPVPPGAVAAAPGAAPQADKAAGPKPIASVVKNSRKYDGLFTLYQDTASGGLHLAVRKDQLGKEHIYFTQAVNGVVAAGYFRGAYGDNKVFSLRKHFNRIEVVTENTTFYFDTTNALSRAATANISPSVLAVQEIVAEDPAKGVYLIKADDLFLTEALAQVKPTPNPNAKPGQSFALGNLSKAKTKYVSIRNYPLNTDVVVEYVYENPAPLVQGGREVTDPRNVSIQMQHSLIEMPQNAFQPRLDDPRLGYFTEQVNDMLSPSATPYRDVINRWHLVKKDPSAAVSEPVEPIVWWMENTTPVDVRPVIREAALKWNEAFEAAGFRNAIVVKQQPDNPDWDAGDMRYNVLRWTSSPQPPFGGYGPSFVNPRTGQILGADVMLEYVYIANRLRQQKVFGVTALNQELADLDARPHQCALGREMQKGTLSGVYTLRAQGVPEAQVSKYLNDALHYLILHEVGHTLGLNHNMKASQMLSPAQLNDRALTQRVGLTGSVMDYPAANIALPGQPQGDFFITKPGPYDVWAIQFGYTEKLDAASREKLLARSTEPALAFGNDADDMRSPGSGMDPRVMIGDLSSDAIGYSIHQFRLVRDAMGKLRNRFSTPGQSYEELLEAYLILSGTQNTAATVISRYIGGVHVDRAMAGQPGATRPFVPVARHEQKRAMQVLAQYLFAPDAFAVPEDLYGYLAAQRRGFNHFGSPEDPKIHDRALNAQRSVIAHLLHPRTLARMSDTRLYGNDYTPSEYMSDLTGAIFGADVRGNVNSFRQNIQLEYVNQLIGVIGANKAQYSYASQSLALQQLRAIQRMLAGKRGSNAETAAHTDHVLFAIRKALETK